MPNGTVVVRIQASDGTTPIFKDFSITINDRNDRPTLQTASFAISENGNPGWEVGKIGYDDEDDDALVFSIVEGNSDLFEFAGNTLKLKAGKTVDFEATKKYTLKVQASDGIDVSLAREISVSVLDLNEAPTGLSITTPIVSELATPDTVVGILSGMDPDANETLSYSLVEDAGGRFVISGNQLLVKEGAILDYEQAKSHMVKVRVTDGDKHSFTQSFTIAVADVGNETTPRDDVLIGSSGRDTLRGGAGNDRSSAAEGTTRSSATPATIASPVGLASTRSPAAPVATSSSSTPNRAEPMSTASATSTSAMTRFGSTTRCSKALDRAR